MTRPIAVVLFLVAGDLMTLYGALYLAVQGRELLIPASLMIDTFNPWVARQ